MIIKDKSGTVINIKQSKDGKIYIPIGRRRMILTKEQADSFCLYEIEDFDLDKYESVYSF